MTAEEGRRRSWRLEWVGVSALCLVALSVRLIGIGWGLPNAQHYFSYHPDEIFLLMPAFGFAQGDWNPHFFNYGTLYIYLAGIPAVLFRLVPDPARFPENLAPLYLTGRIVTALLGAATVPALYLALRWESRSLAWGSATLLTICPLHVINSHYATVDVPATFFLVLAFAFAVRGAGGPTVENALIAGAAVGLAAATKYNAGLFLVPVILAPVFGGRLVRQQLAPAQVRGLAPASWWLGVPAGAAIAFLICNPWIGSAEFRKGFLFELEHARMGGTLAFVGAGNGWSYHLLHGLPVALGYPLAAAVLAGVVLAMRSSCLAVRVSLAWCLFYFAVIGFGKERFIRYLVPMMPFGCVLAAVVIAGSSARVRTARRIARACVASCLVVATMCYLADPLFRLVYPLDVRDRAWEDSDSPLPLAASVGLVGLPWYQHPPVSPYNAGAFSRGFFEAWNEERGRPVRVTGWDAGAVRRDPPEAFALSDLESADPLRLNLAGSRELVSALEDIYQRRQVYRAYRLGAAWLAPARQWAPPDWLYPQPIITVYHSPRQ